MRIQDKLRNFIRTRRAIAELHALDDKNLADLGVSRSQIRAAVEGRL
ncbi:DUF1127 domain-containing protein [Agrobacterium larrymoorei]|uniref:DUF1127 domain-containing protein n=1 Tax=Agrobacterium larrymoorei TaxID=160699 RepID=A0A4D7DY09_9HYPH|nr:DUF1127 domain-containing protein [Agrobacterium larrymoorei]QCJ01149.1 DUF1127 domain-containing protein [Agrobacterium larrymoorei]QYA10162.1 DUF1127 domain-containing protein [Agrobacterium larrymoorei]